MLKDFINRIFDFVLSSLKFLERIKVSKYRKYINTIFIFSASIFLFFFSLNTYAYERIDLDNVKRVDISEVWEIETEKCKIVSVSDGINVQCLVNNLISSLIINGINFISPEITESGYAMMQNPDVPTAAKVSMLSITGNLIDYSLASQPNTDVLAYLQQEWVPGYSDNTSVYAGTGYEFLKANGIIKLYNTFQTIAYVIFVLVLVVTGFMIMFRQKIGGQTAVTIMNTLPNVLIGLVLVTFCFAIVGILLDVGALGTKLVASLYGFENVSDGIVMTSPEVIPSQITNYIVDENLGLDGVDNWMSTLGLIISHIILFVLSFITPAAVVTGPTLLSILVVEILLIAGGIKVFITLIKAFLTILVNTITGPVQITFGTFPGNSKFLQNWLFSTIKAVLSFPLVYAFINIPTLLLRGNDFSLQFSGLVDGSLEAGTRTEAWAGFSVSIVVIGIFIASVYFAADAPKILNDIFPTESGKGLQEAIGGTKGNLSKIPLIGGMFGK